MARPTTAKLDQARIRAAALALVDAEGLERLSMRRLATALDVSAASLYFHYATKDELLEAVAADILANVDTSAFSSGWEPGVRAWARSLRAALAAHPRLVPVLARAGPPRRRAAAGRRHPGRPGPAGWPPREATMIGAAAKYLVFGAALGSFAEGFAADPEVYADRYPHLGQAHRLAARAAEVDRESFDFALEQLIAGLRARYAREMS